MAYTHAPLGFLQDGDGDKSSKRLNGAMATVLAGIFSVVFFITCIIKHELQMALNLTEFLACLGAGLIGGAGVLDAIANKLKGESTND